MAQVNMDLAELKALEQSIEDLKQKNKELKDKQQQVIVHHKYFNATIEINDSFSHHITVEGIYQGNRFTTSDHAVELPGHRNKASLNGLIREGVVKLITTEDVSKNSKEYVNLSEITDIIHKEEKSKIQNDLDLWIKKAQRVNEKLVIAEDGYETSLAKVDQAHNKAITLIKEIHTVDLESEKKN